MKNPFSISKSYVLTLSALRELLREISTEEREYTLDLNLEDCPFIVFHFTQPTKAVPNETSFRVKVLPTYSMFEDLEERIIVCMYPLLFEQVRGGVYYENDELKGDFLEDWKMFWTPIESSLKAKL